MINVNYKFECKEILEASNILLKSQKKAFLTMVIIGYCFGTLFLILGILDALEPRNFLIGSSIIILVLSFCLMLVLILTKTEIVYKRFQKKKHFLLDGAEYSFTLENGKVTVKEKNSKAETVTEINVEEYKKVLSLDKYYYFYLTKGTKGVQIILPKSLLSAEQTEELKSAFGNKIITQNKK